MELVLLAFAFGVAAAGFLAVKKSQPPQLVRVRAASGRRRIRR